MELITPADLEPFADIAPEKAGAMIADVTALAVQAAGCLAAPGELLPGQVNAARAVLRAAILRWEEAGTGARSSVQQAAGNFQISESYDTRQPRRALLRPAEIEQLRAICTGNAGATAFSVDTAPGFGSLHIDSCTLHFGSKWCSCGAILLA